MALRIRILGEPRVLGRVPAAKRGDVADDLETLDGELAHRIEEPEASPLAAHE